MIGKKIYLILFFLISISIGWAEKATLEVWQFSVKGPQTNITLSAKTSAKPAIIWEDVSCQGVPITDIKIGEMEIGKKILSGSKITLYPDRLGVWEYDFGMRRLPEEFFDLTDEEKDKYLAEVYPYNKRLNDPVSPFTRAFVKGRDLKIEFFPSRAKEICYFVDFGKEIEVVGLLVWPWDYHKEDGTGAGASGVWTRADKEGQYTIDIIVSEDMDGKKVIAKRTCTEEEIRRAGLSTGGPFYLVLPGISSFYITIRLSRGEGAHLSGGHFKGFLRYKGDNWPFIKGGENTIIYSERSFPGERSLTFSINHTVLFPEFSGALDGLDITARNCTVERIKPEACPDAYVNNAGILKISPNENFLKEDKSKREFYFTISMPVPMDLRNIKAIRITYRVPTVCGRLQISARGVWGDKTVPQVLPMGAPPIVPDTRQPIPYWTTYEKIVPSPENMGNVSSFTISSWGPTWTLPENDNFCIEIGGIEFIPFKPGERETEERLKKEQDDWQKRSEESPILQRLKDEPLPQGKLINPREIFVRGIYSAPGPLTIYPERKFGCKEIWEYWEKVMDDLKANHLNALHISCYGDQGEVMENFVKLAHKKGFYLWGAGPYMFPHDSQVVEKQWTQIKKELRERLEKWKGVPTFIAWAIHEEPYIWAVPYLKEAREIMTEVGSQPQIIIYNKEGVLLEDVKDKPYPGGVSMDCYPITVSGTRFDRYLDFIKTSWEGAKKIGGVAWFVPQLVERGPYGKDWRAPTQAEVRFQIWTAIAYNIKGFFPFLYQGVKNDDFTNKPFFDYYIQEMARVEILEKLLIAMERDDNLILLNNDDEDKFLIGSFTDRQDKDFRFAVVVNLSTAETMDFPVNPERKIDKVIHIISNSGGVILKEVKPQNVVKIAPGDGQIFFVGSVEKSGELMKRYFK